jgi:hypothetical protein
VSLPFHRWPEAALTLARTFGARGVALRAVHEARRSVGAFRRRPRRFAGPFVAPNEHLFAAGPMLGVITNRDIALARGERVVDGEYQAYRSRWRRLPTDAAGWQLTPAGQPLPANRPWWKVAHLGLGSGSDAVDIKDIWEPARFAWVYDLVRAYHVTHDDRYVAAFHRIFSLWCEASPPFMGVHWSCGQEAAIRAIALLYAEGNLGDAAPSTMPAMARVTSVLAASGERIADAIGHAISQRNNHAISEAVGLLALGSRFRGRHPEAVAWARRGRRLLERLVPEQFAPDGWYIQHSFNYLRLALDQCVIGQHVLRTASNTLPPEAVERLRAAVELLFAVIDPDTGIVPNHGQNDGSFVHPITLGAYRDFRPVLTAACAIFGFEYPRNVPLDEEVLAWLALPEPTRGEPLGDQVAHGESGWAAARVGSASTFLRAAHYTSRPSHIDPLHLDVRFGSREVIADPGTFAYNAAPPWRNALAVGAVHNGPVLDDEEPGVRGPRFLWYVWPTARLLTARLDSGTATIAAEVPDRVRRVVRVTGDRVVVEDTILAQHARRVRIRWLLHPDANPRSVRVDGHSRLLEAHEDSVAGWYSPNYGERIPSRYIEVERDAAPGSRIITEISKP